MARLLLLLWLWRQGFYNTMQCCRLAETRYQNEQLRHKTDMTSSTEMFRNEDFSHKTQFLYEY